MGKSRLEAFSDGMIAIIITIMVLELKVPQGTSIDALAPLIPVFLSYVLSFVYLGIYWNNHHHMLHTSNKVTGSMLWANLHLLFWLSLVPFGTAWMGQNNFTSWPVVLYGVLLLLAACAYFILVRALLSLHGRDSTLAVALRSDLKDKASIAIYGIAIVLALVNSWLACSLYALVAAIWLIPDPRIEKRLSLKE